ncbi:hypothetical protein WJ968_19000 [Achromobacter xylosoxidans]
MRLVGIPAQARKLGPAAGLATRMRQRVVEAHHLRDRLRRQADLVTEPGRQVLAAPAQLARDGLDSFHAARLPQSLVGPGGGRACPGHGQQAAREKRLNDVKAPLPIPFGAQPLAQRRDRVPEQVLGPDHAARDLGHRQIEEPARAGRREADADACAPAPDSISAGPATRPATKLPPMMAGREASPILIANGSPKLMIQGISRRAGCSCRMRSITFS